MLRALALLLILAASGPAEARQGKAKADGAPPAGSRPAASQAPATSLGWTPVLRQNQKQCRAANRCNLDPRVPDCEPCRGK